MKNHVRRGRVGGTRGEGFRLLIEKGEMRRRFDKRKVLMEQKRRQAK